jgi:hypothetical protein
VPPEDRDPATLELTVGVEVATSDGRDGTVGPNQLPLERDALAAGLAAWSAAGVHHVQLGLESATESTYATVIEAIDRFRAGGG